MRVFPLVYHEQGELLRRGLPEKAERRTNTHPILWRQKVLREMKYLDAKSRCARTTSRTPASGRPELAEAVKTAVPTGWASPTWNWGYANGDAHDAAYSLRQKLAKEKARRKWLNSLACNPALVPWEEVKLALALLWQKAARERRDGGLTGWGFVLEQMSAARYEGGLEADRRLVRDMAERLHLLEDISLELDECVIGDESFKRSAAAVDKEEPELASDYDTERRELAIQVLVGLDFMSGGL
ncbi:hypothetical protein CYMTET_20316 [Cymbomonas tetramitiformis]|uniref:Uncharacterized protein n=1 Tax=Cymbomonas tetramitiformis TaxID=36881 RepID=A0AAE0G5N4_9CHLO|nr:hypothetical protein CYMTET_20316 [Cymbomonas tetramitiformis]